MAKIRLSRVFGRICRYLAAKGARRRPCGTGRFTKNYALACFDPRERSLARSSGNRGPADDPFRCPCQPKIPSPLRGLLPLWVGVGVYALFLLAGNRLLIDPDTMWQITVGQWILDHRAVPDTDVYSFTMRGQPWISTQWLAQVLYAKAYALAGWSGPVVLAGRRDRRRPSRC